MRAAFKAVLDGKQVAILVPTTILAQQHFQTFSERLRPFPVNVEMLSRFRTYTRQQRSVQDGINLDGKSAAAQSGHIIRRQGGLVAIFFEVPVFAVRLPGKFPHQGLGNRF